MNRFINLQFEDLYNFKDKQIKNIFIEQNIWITIISILIGLPSGYYLTVIQKMFRR